MCGQLGFVYIQRIGLLVNLQHFGGRSGVSLVSVQHFGVGSGVALVSVQHFGGGSGVTLVRPLELQTWFTVYRPHDFKSTRTKMSLFYAFFIIFHVSSYKMLRMSRRGRKRTSNTPRVVYICTN